MSASPITTITYIASSQDRVWSALTTPELTRRYWFDTAIESDWQVGSFVHYRRDGKITDEGVVLVAEPGCLLSYTFHPLLNPNFRKEPPSRVTFRIERDPHQGAVVRLTTVHDLFPPDSKVHPSCADGWPMIISNLKTLLETGRPLPPYHFTRLHQRPTDQNKRPSSGDWVLGVEKRPSGQWELPAGETPASGT